MRKIEFVGASGVGKTTLYKELLALCENRVWKTPAEARIEIARNMKLTSFKGLKLLRLLCLKFNFFKNHHAGMAVNILDKYIDQIVKNNIYKYNDLLNLMLKAIVLDCEFDAYKKAQFIKFYMDMLRNDVMTLEGSEYNNLVVYEDGILHNTYGLYNEKHFNEMVEKNHNILELIMPKGVVFCQLSVEENISRRNKRIASGLGTFFENNTDQETIAGICKSDLDAANKKIIILQKYGIPILNIDTSKPLKDNAKQVNNFIDKILKNV